MKHQSINQSINQSTICPPNVVDFGRYPIHIEMQCIAVCRVERHQKYKYYNTYLSQCTLEGELVRTLTKNTHDVIAQIIMADEDS